VSAVLLVGHDPRWAAAAAAEIARWQALPGCAAAHHVGSTAIRGIDAKPILDLMPLFDSPQALDDARPAIEALGYLWRGENGIPRRRYCTRAAGAAPAVHAHCFVQGDPEAARHLHFRDHLRRHPDRARAYEADKHRCAALHPSDRAAYSACKAALIARLEAEAAR
jgi:GrpB-like predicted nucleotidyltransferase (UPF0157 family)